MANSTFHSGQHGKMKAVSQNGTPISPAADLPTSKWGMTIKGNNKDVSNSRDGRKRVPGLQDAELTFELPYDSANDPTLVANGGLTDRSVIVFNGYIDDTHFYAGTFIVDEIGPGSEIEGEVNFTVKASMESGTITYPVYP